MMLRSELVYRTLFENRAVRGFLGAIPGLDAYAMLGKAWWHTTELDGTRPRYDLVILDGPASGHAALMLRIPGAILQAMPKGPLARDARAMRALTYGPGARRAGRHRHPWPRSCRPAETAELAAAARGRCRCRWGPSSSMPSHRTPCPTPRRTPSSGPCRLTRVTPRSTRPFTWRPACALTGASPTTCSSASRETWREAPSVTLPRLPTADIGPAEVALLAARLATAPRDGGATGPGTPAAAAEVVRQSVARPP